MQLFRACLLACLLNTVVSKKLGLKAGFVKSVHQANNVVKIDHQAPRKLTESDEGDFEYEIHPNFWRRRVDLLHHRRNKQDFSKEENCDKALLICLPEEECAQCFRYLYAEDIDWGTVTPDTKCDDVLKFLAGKDYCPDMHDDDDAKEAFCQSFDACAVWEDDDDNDYDMEDDDYIDVDCSTLTECNWPGMHQSFIGDSICHDGIGCYNTQVCNWDGGDCCEDTCESGNYVECGHEGFVCRNPNSTKCDPQFSLDCKDSVPDGNNPDPADTKCTDSETKYRLLMYDSFGDGWDTTKLKISSEGKTKYDGGLKSGSKGVEYICLPKDSKCLHVDVSGGEWANEVSWEVKPMNEGAPALAAGSSPMDCDFSVGGKACEEDTCNGKANKEPNTDPEYKEFKDMYNCIEDKCAIQVGKCKEDEACEQCLADEKADFCYGSEEFVAVVDCSMCRCTDRTESDFCEKKPKPLSPVNPSNNGDGRLPDGSPRACSPAETMKGSNAVLNFASCSHLDQITMLVTNYKENSFGLLDRFESCSHNFKNDPDRGGHTALGCMKILVNAMNDNDTEGQGDESSEFKEAVKTLAELLYHHAGDFCECAANTSADCPLCSSFIHVKTLLYESLDACQSLDEIDCDAWNEFSNPCQSNLKKEFDSIDFGKEEICKYVHDGCGGAGPFPAFRRIDCDGEIPDPAWDFYKDYASKCLENDDSDLPRPTPSGGKDVPVPTTPRPTSGYTPESPNPPPTPRPTAKPYVPSGGSSSSTSNKKPYIPKDDTGSDSYSSNGKKSHFFRNFFLVGFVGVVGYVYYKRRTDAFSFVRYRNARNYAGGESEMYSTAPYSGLAMDSSGTFQPPALPPTPSAIDGGQY